MKNFNTRMLASASVAVIATFALAGAASAQGTEPPVTGSEAQDCAKLATQPERDACLQGQAEDQRGTEESGSADTIAPEERAEQRSETENTIVVTGSRLRRSAFSNSPDPLTVIDPELARQQGQVETAEVLQSTPVAAGSTQVTSFLSSNFVFNGGQGVQTLSLRGLGAERTLVLLDGRRAGPSGVRGGVGAFDLNVLPTSIVRSVEVVKTGASSVYGSDAIAGVVNILTRRDTDGIELRVFGSIPEESGGETYQVSGTWGKEFDRGHVLLTGSWERRQALERRDRDFLDCSIDLIENGAGQRVDILDPRTGEPACLGDSNIGNIFIAGNFANGGGNNLQAPPGSASTVTSITLLQFHTPGSGTDIYGFPLRPAVNNSSFVAPAGWFAVNFNSPSTGILRLNPEVQQRNTVIPRTTRYTLFGSGSYELNDNIEAFADLLYSRRETNTVLHRALFTNQFTSDARRVADNAVVATFCPATTSFGSPNPYCDPTDIGDPINVGFTGAQVIQPATYVPFTSDIKIDYYRAVGGLRGEVNLLSKPWRWEAWGQYSHSDGKYRGDVIFQDAVDAMTLRTNSCVGMTTEIRGAQCVDINLTDPRILLDANFTDAERAFLFGSETGNTKYKQWTGEATISGDLIDLWAGPLQASLGVHIRRDSINDTPGDVTLSGNSWGLSASGITSGHAVTTEAFGEMSLPLFEDRPIGSAEITGAARVTNYKAERNDGLSDKDNGNWTYKLGANWAVTDWLRLRSTYGTSYRAPQLFEQFLADETSFLAQNTIDPCIQWGVALANGTISQNLADACAAQGVAPTYLGLNSSATIFTGGGIGVLDPETSKAFTASVIFTPPPIWEGMRFSFAVDYYSIKVKGEITNLGPANIVRSCLLSEFFPTDPLCGLFDRVNDPTATNNSMIVNVRDPFINVDTQLNRGYDFTARLTQDMGSKGMLTLLGQATYQVEDAFELFAGTPANNNGEAGDPKWVGQLDATWAKKPFTVLYTLNYVGATSDRSDIRTALGADLCANNAFRGVVCPDFRLERTFYHHASITADLFDRFQVTAGVRNIFDTPPPSVSRVNQQSGGVIGQGVALLGSQYDYLGRRFFASVTAKF